jgi:hypothetical protein
MDMFDGLINVSYKLWTNYPLFVCIHLKLTKIINDNSRTQEERRAGIGGDNGCTCML